MKISEGKLLTVGIFQFRSSIRTEHLLPLCLQYQLFGEFNSLRKGRAKTEYFSSGESQDDNQCLVRWELS